MCVICVVLYPGVVNDRIYTAYMYIVQNNILYAVESVFTNFPPCSHTINPNHKASTPYTYAFMHI